MKLQTNIPLSPAANQIDYSSKVLLMGSCFSTNIAEKLSYFKFDNLSNPFGIVFNPIAIEHLIERAVKDIKFTENDIFFHNERWQSFEVHSELSTTDQSVFLEKINAALLVLSAFLKTSSHIIFTLGTAWVYEYLAANKVVANCHKVPQTEFKKRLLSVAEITESLLRVRGLISAVNPNATIIYTVSPVRHVKDGIIENSHSKAHLITGTHQFKNPQSPISNLQSFYFPSFEIMMDELRDYRFYAKDMLHPNETAIEIIWEKFKHVWIASETVTLQKKIAEIQNGLKHRPFNATSEAHEKFLENLQQKISEVKKELPWVKFNK